MGEHPPGTDSEDQQQRIIKHVHKQEVIMLISRGSRVGLFSCMNFSYPLHILTLRLASEAKKLHEVGEVFENAKKKWEKEKEDITHLHAHGILDWTGFAWQTSAHSCTAYVHSISGIYT